MTPGHTHKRQRWRLGLMQLRNLTTWLSRCPSTVERATWLVNKKEFFKIKQKDRAIKSRNILEREKKQQEVVSLCSFRISKIKKVTKIRNQNGIGHLSTNSEIKTALDILAPIAYLRTQRNAFKVENPLQLRIWTVPIIKSEGILKAFADFQIDSKFIF